ncbi:MAG: ABC transporter permease [Actinomycetota bacterium]|nr:ABC transporter permease [Actinomycetota bacterium]MDD5667266.1 ABC transporter permease [Actinomycetota bacterium]
MKMPRFLTVTKRVFMDLKNDKRSLALIVIAPIFVMFVFGLAFSGEVKNIKVVVVDLDEGAAGVSSAPLPEKIISNLDEEVLELEYADGREAALEMVENGEAYAAVIFPPDLTSSALSGMADGSPASPVSIELLLDRSNINVANAVTKEFNDALLATVEEAGMGMPVKVDATAVFGENAKFMDFFVPGIMAFAVYMITTLLTLVTFVGERTSGTLQRMLATTLKERDIVLGYAAAFSLIGIGQAILLLLVGILVFDVTVVGNVLLAFLVIALLAIVSQALGILLSSTARREAQAIQVLPFVILPAFLLAGIFWPIEAIPAWLRPLSYLVPPTYAVDASRAVMLKGWGMGKIWIDIVALVAMAAFFLFLAVLSLRTRKD